MSIRSLRRLFALLLGFALAAPALARAAEPGSPADWFPLGSRGKRVYEVHRDHTYRPEDAKIDRVFHAGRMTETVEPAPGPPAGAFRVRNAIRLDPVSGGGSPEALAQWTVLSAENEVRIHASGETDERGRSTDASYAPPLRLLPTTEVGASWKVGTYRSGDRRAELRGTVLGFEDVPGEPAWPACLKVRLEGKLGGSVPVHQGLAEIEEARFERTLWLARGIGIVREVAKIDAALRLPDGKRADTAQVLTLRLVDAPAAP